VKKHTLKSIVSACTLFAAVCAPLTAQAQIWGQPNGQQQQPGQQQQQQKRPNTYKADPHAFDTVSVYSAPDLPYFPQWTGQKPLFIEGLTFPNKLPKMIYTLIWQYREPAGTVISWYTDALRGTGFEIIDNATRANVINARHTREPVEICIQVSPAAKSGYKCTAEVRYIKSSVYKKNK
jgi:hypothetical protein